ncbi:MAG: arylsulfatase [Verrucomicrobiota bacterium]
MNRFSILWITLLLPALTASSHGKDSPPSIVIILADDLGFSDPGCYGGEIATPHLDQLAQNGLRFTQFYNTARCWPSRAALLTGFYAQQIRRDKVPGVKSGGRGKRPSSAPLLSQQLKTNGYRSYHSGKWHLDGMPLENGFERSYYLKDQGRFFNPRVHYLNDQPLPPVEPGTGFYGTTAVATHAIDWLRHHAKEASDQPFLLYLAFAAPHFPLHALPEDIERYRNTYGDGWDTVRKQRWARQRELGLFQNVPLSKPETAIGPPYHFPEALKTLGAGEVNRPVPWASLTPEQKRFQAEKMRLHAAMVDRMDREIGRVVDQLRAMKAFDNTLILFLSDNGASAEIMVRDDGHDPTATPGSAPTYLCLGPGWSMAANTPFRRHKTWVHEGGTATPLIAHWPAGIKDGGRFEHQTGHVIDIVPTILELTGTSSHAKEQHPWPGLSLASALTDPKNPAVERDLWFCHEENRAIRQGDWKLVAAKGDPWELYHLRVDRSETNNLAAKEPDRVAAMAAEWEKQWKAYCARAAAP